MSRISLIRAAALVVALVPAAVEAQTDVPPPTPGPTAAPVASVAPIVRSPLYVIVPFGEPGDTNPILANATQKFSEDLSDRRVRSTLGTPIDAVEAVANAHAICTQYSANGILISTMRFGQTDSFNVPAFATGFIPYVGGVISGAGALNRLPIKAQYKLYLVDCRGKVAWRTMTSASKVHHGNNVAAGMTEIGLQAVAEAADQFAARRSQTH